MRNIYTNAVCEERERMKLVRDQKASQPICSQADIEKTGNALDLKKYLEKSFG